MQIKKAPKYRIVNKTGIFDSTEVRDYYHEYYLKQFVEWLNSTCPHKTYFLSNGNYEPATCGECDKCIEALRKEAGEDD